MKRKKKIDFCRKTLKAKVTFLEIILLNEKVTVQCTLMCVRERERLYTIVIIIILRYEFDSILYCIGRRRKNSKKMAFKCQFIFMYTTKTESVGKSGLHIYVKRKPWQIAHRMYAIRIYWLVELSLLRFPTISSVILLKGGVWTYSVHIHSIVHPLCLFSRLFTAIVHLVVLHYMYFTDGWFLSPEIYIDSTLSYIWMHQYNQKSFVCTTCSSFSHGIAQFLLRFLFILLGTHCYYCLQSHPNSLSTHDEHNATLKQWHLDMSKSLERW